MAKKTILKRMAKLLPKSDALNTVLKMDDETNYKEPVNITPNGDRPLSRLEQSIGLKQEDAEESAQNLIKKINDEKTI